MTEYEKLLDKMRFTIHSTLIDNDICRNGSQELEPLPETEIIRYNRRTYMELKVMMMRLERALYGEKNYEKDDSQVSDRDTRSGNDTEDRQEAARSSRVGNFSC